MKANELTNISDMANFIIEGGTACRFVGITSETEPKLKKSCPFVGVRKISRKVGMVNVNYASAVDRRIAQILGCEVGEVTHTPGTTWYQHVTTPDGRALPLVHHKDPAKVGNFYLQFFPRKSVDKYVDAQGNEIAESELEPHFYSKGERKEYKPAVIVLSLDNIKELRASGQVVTAEDMGEAEKSVE